MTLPPKPTTSASMIRIYNGNDELIALVDPLTGKRRSVSDNQEITPPPLVRKPRPGGSRRSTPSPSVPLDRRGKWR